MNAKRNSMRKKAQKVICDINKESLYPWTTNNTKNCISRISNIKTVTAKTPEKQEAQHASIPHYATEGETFFYKPRNQGKHEPENLEYKCQARKWKTKHINLGASQAEVGRNQGCKTRPRQCGAKDMA